MRTVTRVEPALQLVNRHEGWKSATKAMCSNNSHSSVREAVLHYANIKVCIGRMTVFLFCFVREKHFTYLRNDTMNPLALCSVLPLHFFPFKYNHIYRLAVARWCTAIYESSKWTIEPGKRKETKKIKKSLWTTKTSEQASLVLYPTHIPSDAFFFYCCHKGDPDLFFLKAYLKEKPPIILAIISSCQWNEIKMQNVHDNDHFKKERKCSTGWRFLFCRNMYCTKYIKRTAPHRRKSG